MPATDESAVRPHRSAAASPQVPHRSSTNAHNTGQTRRSQVATGRPDPLRNVSAVRIRLATQSCHRRSIGFTEWRGTFLSYTARAKTASPTQPPSCQGPGTPAGAPAFLPRRIDVSWQVQVPARAETCVGEHADSALHRPLARIGCRQALSVPLFATVVPLLLLCGMARQAPHPHSVTSSAKMTARRGRCLRPRAFPSQG